MATEVVTRALDRLCFFPHFLSPLSLSPFLFPNAGYDLQEMG